MDLNLLRAPAIGPVQKNAHQYQHECDQKRGPEYGFGLFF